MNCINKYIQYYIIYLFKFDKLKINNKKWCIKYKTIINKIIINSFKLKKIIIIIIIINKNKIKLKKKIIIIIKKKRKE